MIGRRVRRTRNGDFAVRLPEVERQLLGALVASLRAALDGDVREDADPVVDPDDPAAPLAEIYAYLGVLLESLIAALEEG